MLLQVILVSATLITPPLPQESRCAESEKWPGGHCPQDIIILPQPPMEPAPEGAACAEGWKWAPDRTYCVPNK